MQEVARVRIEKRSSLGPRRTIKPIRLVPIANGESILDGETMKIQTSRVFETSGAELILVGKEDSSRGWSRRKTEAQVWDLLVVESIREDGI